MMVTIHLLTERPNTAHHNAKDISGGELLTLEAKLKRGLKSLIAHDFYVTWHRAPQCEKPVSRLIRKLKRRETFWKLILVFYMRI